MNSATNLNVSKINHTTQKNRLGGYVFMTILLGIFGANVTCATHQAASAAPVTAESLFADAVKPESDRLKSAREAAKRGDCDLAIHDFIASIQEDTSTADQAIPEMVKVFLTLAEAHRTGGEFVNESYQIKRCYQVLIKLKEADAVMKTLPEPARVNLFKEISQVQSVGNDPLDDLPGQAARRVCSRHHLRGGRGHHRLGLLPGQHQQRRPPAADGTEWD